MTKSIFTLSSLERMGIKFLVLFIVFQILSFSSFAQTTFIKHTDNNRTEFSDQNGNTKTAFQQTPAILNNLSTKQLNEANGTLWENVGPIGGDILDIAVCPDNPSIVFAVGSNSFKSTDGGTTWSTINALAEMSNSMSSVCALPNGKIIVAGGYFYGKYAISEDFGNTWTEELLPPNSSSGQLCLVLDIVCDPSNSSVVYFGTSAAYGNEKSEVLYKSTDGGSSFELMETNILDPSVPISDIAIDPTNSDIIYAISSDGLGISTIIISIDGGSNWTDCSNGLNTEWMFNSVATYNGVTYLGGGQAYGSQFFGLYQSTDCGNTWQELSTSFPNKMINDVVLSPDNSNIIYLATAGDGIYKSTDAGNTWEFTTTGADNFSSQCIVVSPNNPQELLAGFLNMAVYKSIDAGASLEASSTGINALMLNDIAVNPVNSLQMLASFEAHNCGGCYFTENGGESWVLLESMPMTRYSAVAIDTNGILYAWSNGPSTVAQEGLYKSVDGGDTWNNMGPNVGSYFETEINDIVISHDNPENIIICGNNYGYNGHKGIVHKSSNSGQSWDVVYTSQDDYDVFKKVDLVNNTAYLAMHSQDGMGLFLKSIDSGDTWGIINNGMPSDMKTANCIVADKTNPETVFGIGGSNPTYFSVFRSDDGGSNWTDLNLHTDPWQKLTCLAIHPEDNNMIYVASQIPGEPIFVTINNGETWKLASDGFPLTTPTSFSEMVKVDNSYYLYSSTISASAYGAEIHKPVFIELDGIVTDVSTSNPIANAQISMVSQMIDYSFTSNAEGKFEQDEFVVGIYNIKCVAEGYNIYYEDDVEIAETTTLNIELTSPTIQANVTEIIGYVSPDGFNTTELSISNDGSGTLEWHSSISFEDEYGDIVFQLNNLSEQTPENSSIFGCEYDGANLWVVCTGSESGFNHFLCKFDLEGNLLATYDQNIGSWGLRGIYFHEDGYLYGGSNVGFHRIDINNGTITQLFDWKFGLSCLRGLTYAPPLGGFVARDYNTDFVIFDVEGNQLGTLPKPDGVSSSVADIDYDPIHDCIWLYDRSGSANTKFYQYSICQGALTDVVIDIPLFNGVNSQRAGGSFFSSTLIPGKYVLAGATNSNDPFDVLFAVEICPSWIKTIPNYSFIEPSESHDVTVGFDGFGLVDGDKHYCTLHLNSCNPDVGTINIPVTLHVQNGVGIVENLDFPGLISPNPFAESVNIQFTLKHESMVTLTVCDITGKLVSTLIHDQELSGTQIINWDGISDSGDQTAPGIYLVVLQENQRRTCSKVFRVF
jgi:photosystem II stability/assembly factor-like uncharacterized protein